MTIRHLKPEEYVHYRGIGRLVLWGKDDIRQQMKDPMAHAPNDDSVRLGAFDDKGILQSGMTIEPYTIRMNGRDVKMGGVAGVLTRPNARGQGLARKIFEVAFKQMIEDGQTFSFLFPFSRQYYRKFGYELCSFNNIATIPIDQFSGYPYPQNIQQHEPDDDITPFMQIYEQFAENRNLSIVRDSKRWQTMLNRDPYKNYEFTYLNRDENGTPNAYVLYSPILIEGASSEPWHRMLIKELCWTTPAGLHNIFGFLAKLSPEYASVQWKVPCGINAHSLFPGKISLTETGDGMNRILDVTAGLSTLRAPQGSGKLNLEITDTFWSSNSGTYVVEWESGNLTVNKTTSSNIDMATGIETLAQLVPGLLTPEECMYKSDTTIYNNHTQLLQLFPKQKLHMTETF